MVKVREKSELKTVRVGENLQKLQQRGFLNPKIYSILLPYFDELEPEVDRNFQRLVDGLVATFLTENWVEAEEYTDMMQTYLHQFGIRFKKEKYLELIKFFYEAIVKEKPSHRMLRIACMAVERLVKQIKPGSLGWRDMTLDWKPLYERYVHALTKKENPDTKPWLDKVLYYLSWFYDPKEHSAIWERALEELTIGSETSMVKFTTICWSFLTTMGMTVEDVSTYCSNTWLRELWKMYLDAEMNTTWTVLCVDVFADVITMTPEAFDLSPYYDVLFTKMMRSFNLTVRGGKLSVGDGQEAPTSSKLAQLCAYTIGGPRSSLPHFKRLMHYIQFNVHPMNTGEHADLIADFLYNFLSHFKTRIKRERLAEQKRKCPKEYYLTDEDIDKVTEAITDVCLMLMFTENRMDDYKVIYVLTAMNREYVAPKMLDHLYSSLNAINEPGRLTIAIESFYMVIYEIIRQPDPEYRTPRAMIYDATWLGKLEEQRKEWPTYKLGSEVPEIQKHTVTSLRAHAFYIMEIFANNIDVNDVNRSTFILKTLIILFSSFPLMDFSEASEHHEMSDDDKIVCKLSKRLPNLVEFVMQRILGIVNCLSVCPPKTSGTSLTSEDVEQEGVEETSLKTGISQCVTAIFERSSEPMKAQLFDTLFAFVTTSEFSGYMATQLLCAIVSAATWQSPTAFKRFAQFVDQKLSALLTEEVQKSKSATSSVLFHVVMARAVFSAPHQLVLENEEVLGGILELMLKCQCKKIFKAGIDGLMMLLFALLTINTEAAASPDNQKFRRPLKEWNPIHEWAKCIHYKDLTLVWYLPGKLEVTCAQRLLNRFLFPYVQLLGAGNLDRETLRLYTMLIDSVIVEVPFFRHPESGNAEIPDEFTPYQLPNPPTSLNSKCSLELELTGPNGENAREMLLSMVEKVVKITQDPMTLTQLAGIAFSCLGHPLSNKFMDSDLEESLTDVNKILKDSTYCKVIKASQHTMDELAYFRHAHVEAYDRCETRLPNGFDRRILQILVELAMNDYAKVRKTALAYLSKNQTQLYRCRGMILPKILEVITDQKIQNADRLKGALNLITTLGMMNSVNAKIRCVVWDAVLRMKVMDDVEVCALFDTIVQAIYDIDRHPIYLEGTYETEKERNAKVAEIGARIISGTEPFTTPESLAAQSATWHEFEQNRHVLRAQLAEQLFARYVGNKSLHHTREKLARSMILNMQREAADERTVRMMLTQLGDEEYAQRYEARVWLQHWMWKNKPKTQKEHISMKSSGNRAESGLREDNVWLMYDSKRLPDTEHAWNRTTFVEKDWGACRWARTIFVTRQRIAGPPLESKPITPSDQLIIDYFSSPAKMTAFFETRVIEKEEFDAPSDAVYDLYKYVINNYPEATRPLELLTESLKSILDRKPKKEDQLLAAELFAGIVLGLKHRTFQENAKFWSQMCPRLDEFFNEMLGEAEESWTTVIRQLILSSNSDPRRHWWLVESLLAGVKRAKHATDVQQAFRLRCVMVKRWRCGEIMNRLVAIAYSKLPFSITDALRYAIASVLRAAIQIREMNNIPASTTSAAIEPRFSPETLDETIRKLTEHIPQLAAKKRRTSEAGGVLTRCSKSDPELRGAMTSPPRKRLRKRSLSPGSAEEKTSNIYMRTLLECILQYYDVSMHSWTPALVRLLPKLVRIANEESFDLSEETYRNVDIAQNSALLTHDYMSTAWLSAQFVDDVVEAWRAAFQESTSWRVRLEVVKFIQASVYSNMFAMGKTGRREAVERLLLEALFDENITVRKETAKCLLLFIHCAYITLPRGKIDELGAILNTPHLPEPRHHGAALGLGAVALAHPFSLPPVILKPLEHLNSSQSSRAFVKNEITSMLREFRRQHRDDWERVRQVVGEKLAFDIENATAPAYYA